MKEKGRIRTANEDDVKTLTILLANNRYTVTVEQVQGIDCFTDEYIVKFEREVKAYENEYQPGKA